MVAGGLKISKYHIKADNLSHKIVLNFVGFF